MRQLGECGSARAWGLGPGAGMGGPLRLTCPLPHLAGYLGYSSGFSLSCMMFFLIAVSHPPPGFREGAGLSGQPGSGGQLQTSGSARGFTVTSQDPCLALMPSSSPCPLSTTHLGHLQKVPRALPAVPQCDQRDKQRQPHGDRQRRGRAAGQDGGRGILHPKLLHAKHSGCSRPGEGQQAWGECRPGESVGLVRGVACPDTESVFLQTAYTIPIMAFAFVCHPEVLPIYTELKE